jgi:hypothetical protein
MKYFQKMHCAWVYILTNDEAIAREKVIKKKKREWKEALIASMNAEWKVLDPDHVTLHSPSTFSTDHPGTLNELDAERWRTSQSIQSKPSLTPQRINRVSQRCTNRAEACSGDHDQCCQ